jgi:hypothetical protein
MTTTVLVCLVTIATIVSVQAAIGKVNGSGTAEYACASIPPP